MSHRRTHVSVLLLGLVLTLVAVSRGEEPPHTIDAGQKLFAENNFADAAAAYAGYLADHGTKDPAAAWTAATERVRCLLRLARYDDAEAAGRELPKLFAATAWEPRGERFLGRLLIEMPHHGSRQGGVFKRGDGGQGMYVTRFVRDRNEAIEHLERARDLYAKHEPSGVTRTERVAALFDLVDAAARFTAYDANWSGSWAEEDPDGDGTIGEAEDEGYRRRRTGGFGEGLAVDASGRPIFEPRPATYTADLSPTEKIKYLLHEATALDPTEDRRFEAAALHRAGALARDRYGPHRLGYAWQYGHADRSQLQTLADDEAFTLVAGKLRVVKLPADEDVLALFRQVGERFPKSEVADEALLATGQYRQQRQQFLAALAAYDALEARHPKSDLVGVARGEAIRIRMPEAAIGGAAAQLAGGPASFDLTTRNVDEVALVAHRLDFERFTRDILGALERDEKDAAGVWTLQNTAHHLYNGDLWKKYVVKEDVAKWSVKVERAPDHTYRPVKVEAPFREPGLYALMARTGGEQRSIGFLLLEDLAIVEKQVEKGKLVYVCDPRTGKPVPDAKVELFECWDRWEKSDERSHHEVRRSSDETGADGTVIARHGEEHWCQLVAIARAPDGRVAIGGVGGWGRYQRHRQDHATRAFVVTDRPVYRPGHTAHVKLFARTSDDDGYRRPKKQRVEMRLHDPRGQEIRKETLETDEAGGLDFDHAIDAKAPLGVYQVQLAFPDRTWQGTQFRVEEYRKPEFEVTIEPGAERVRLGEKIAAKIVAKYHFGGPVLEATVKYRIFREAHVLSWSEPGRWDWLYGRGYGCCFGWWWTPPWGGSGRELVMSGELPMGADGTLSVEVDTADLAKAENKTDYSFVVEADVRDASRRTISGSGSVIAARQPIYVFIEADRGYYRPGEEVRAVVRTLTPEGKPVAAAGRLRFARVRAIGPSGAVDVEPTEGVDAKTDAEGRLETRFAPQAPGMYRIAFEAATKDGNNVEGATLVWVHGPGADAGIAIPKLELVPDRKTYAPGETAKVLVRVPEPGATIIFADRVDSGTLISWKLIRVDGRFMVIDVPLGKGDVPNRWLEATLVQNGRVETVACELLVPPTESALEVEVKLPKEVFRPGEEATIEVTAKTPDGAPAEADLVLYAFDKSVLQIQGETTPEIRSFFWNRRRWHHPSVAASLGRFLQQIAGLANPATVYMYRARADGRFGMDDSGVFALGDMDQSRDRLGARSETRGALAKAEGGAKQPAAEAPATPAPAPPAGGESAQKEKNNEAGSGGQGGGRPLVEPQVRSKFADTALWAPSVRTGKDGKATTTIKFPENLTTWAIRAHGITRETRVGSAAAEVRTSKDLLVRLAAPRFLVERDEVVLSAIVMNRLKTSKKAVVRLVLGGGGLDLAPGTIAEQSVEVAAGGEARVDWLALARVEGTASIQVEARTDEESDAMKIEIPVRVHGSDRTVARTGSLRAGSETLAFEVPAAVRKGQTRLEVRLTPSLAGAMLDAIPYLLEYPYGCTEQTLNRFLPAVQTMKTLGDIGVDLEELARNRPARYTNIPVFSTAELHRIVAAGIERMGRLQHGDGGFGWWSNDISSAYMTALVANGLITAREADAPIDESMIDRALGYLAGWTSSGIEDLRERPDRAEDRVFATYVLARRKRHDKEVLDLVHKHRAHLSPRGLAYLALAHRGAGDAERAKLVTRNLLQHLEKDDEVQTAWIKTSTHAWWWWWNDAIETSALALQAVVADDPKSDVAPRLVKWLLQNRRNGLYWRSTRDTAAVISSFADYLRATKELTPNLDVTLSWDGAKIKSFHIDRTNVLTLDGSILLSGDAVDPGKHALTISREGEGALYYSAWLSYFTLEEDVPAAGLDLKVERRVYRLDPIEEPGKELRYKRVLLASGDDVRSGEMLEVELLVKSKNDYEYLCFEDPKPAGCEPIAVQSGARYGELWSNVELRDQQVVFFASWLNQGDHRLSYRLRAEAPGKYHALPTKGYAMYAPEIVGTSAEMRIGVKEAAEVR